MAGSWVDLHDRPVDPARGSVTASLLAVIPLHVSPKTVSRWAAEGKLPFLKTLGAHRRYPAAEIRQLADQLQVRPTA
jgi:excisionase family DNA binding protein